MKPRTGSNTLEAPATPNARSASQELWRQYQRRAGSEIENSLVEQYLPLVRSIVGRLAMSLPDHVDASDLHSAGLIGLVQAMRNYDMDCGTSFESYARVRIRGAMLDELRRMDWVPRTVHEKARRIQQTLGALEQKLGRNPTDEEMAKALNVTVEDYGGLLNEIRPAAFVCLDSTACADGSDNGSLYEVIADPNDESPLDEVSRNELKEVVFERIQQLPDIQRKVLALYYHEDLHLREIAAVFGLTESRICQIHSQAILSIRAHIQRYESGVAGNVAYPRR
jgi:RNA polymerase sigma factor for flagellar operon FliA